jgi:hypothetical protein
MPGFLRAVEGRKPLNTPPERLNSRKTTHPTPIPFKYEIVLRLHAVPMRLRRRLNFWLYGVFLLLRSKKTPYSQSFRGMQSPQLISGDAIPTTLAASTAYVKGIAPYPRGEREGTRFAHTPAGSTGYRECSVKPNIPYTPLRRVTRKLRPLALPTG